MRATLKGKSVGAPSEALPDALQAAASLPCDTGVGSFKTV